jgi:hypothetical protein
VQPIQIGRAIVAAEVALSSTLGDITVSCYVKELT